MNKKISICVLILCSICLSCSDKKKSNLGSSGINEVVDVSGSWVWEDGDAESIFSLNLKQENNKITGSHIAAAMNGNRIDDNDNSISGNILGNVINIKYISGYSGEEGEAIIKIIGKG